MPACNLLFCQIVSFCVSQQNYIWIILFFKTKECKRFALHDILITIIKKRKLQHCNIDKNILAFWNYFFWVKLISKSQSVAFWLIILDVRMEKFETQYVVNNMLVLSKSMLRYNYCDALTIVAFLYIFKKNGVAFCCFYLLIWMNKIKFWTEKQQ